MKVQCLLVGSHNGIAVQEHECIQILISEHIHDLVQWPDYLYSRLQLISR
jgi:hypothetical protein